MYRFGHIKELNGKRRENIFIDKGSYFEIHFSCGRIAYIDREDYKKVSEYYWGINSQGYLHSRIEGKLKRMHLYILDFPNKTVDHINRNKLDNRKSNLRECNQSDNTKNVSVKKNNTSGVPGVSLNKKTGKWRARIMVNRKEISLGHYELFEDAAKARKEGELKYYGEFAPIHQEWRSK